MSFANLSLTRKVGVLAGALGFLVLAGTGTGLVAVRGMADGIDRLNHASDSAVLAAGMGQDALQIRLVENRIVIDPTAQTIATARRALAQRSANIRKGLAEARTHAGELRLAMIARIEPAVAAYLVAAEKTFTAAEAVADGTGQRDAVLAALDAGVPIFEALYALKDEYQTLSTSIASAHGDEIAALAATARWLMAGLAGGGVLLAGLLAWTIGTRGIARPIAASAARLKTLAEGEIEAPIPGEGRKDEVGAVAAAMAIFRDNIVRERAMQAGMARKEEEAKAEQRRALIAAADRFDAEVGGVVRTVATAATEMEATASGMAQGAEETQRQAASVAASAGQASANVQTVAAAAEELAASVGEISRQVAESTRIAEEAVGEATRTSATVQALSDNAQKISDVVRLISEIAGQTNLLALNATIEAARAGEAGKGFAVVASEVKNLAAQTAKATDEIAGQVSAVQGETARVVEAIRGMGEVIGRLSAIATSIAAAVEEQGAATGEIARNVQEAAAGTSSVTRTIDGVNASATSSGAAAAQVQAAARDLSRGAETLKAQLETFLAQMKAA